jgi:hypothetical protein
MNPVTIGFVHSEAEVLQEWPSPVCSMPNTAKDLSLGVPSFCRNGTSTSQCSQAFGVFMEGSPELLDNWLELGGVSGGDSLSTQFAYAIFQAAGQEMKRKETAKQFLHRCFRLVHLSLPEMRKYVRPSWTNAIRWTLYWKRRHQTIEWRNFRYAGTREVSCSSTKQCWESSRQRGPMFARRLKSFC